MSIKQLSLLATPEYGCDKAYINTDGLSLTLHYVYENDETGNLDTDKIVFERVVAFTFYDEAHVDIWPLEAHDAIAEDEDSEWLKILQTRVPRGNSGWPFDRHHYIVCLRNHGCYEIVAERFKEET
jgi:hypothetical protein